MKAEALVYRESAQGAASSMDGYCTATGYCDIGHPGIRELAWELTRGLEDDRQRAIVIHHWVRDRIRYSILHNWSQRASETLAMGVGTCTNKANLLVALLRAAGVPAGYHVMRVRGKHYFGPVWIPMLQRLCDELTVHQYAAVHLDGRWVQVDPSCDRAMSEGVGHINPPFRHTVFDGRAHAGPSFEPDHVITVSECLPNIDWVIAKRTRKPPIYFKIMDLFIEFGRTQGKHHTSCTMLEPAFRQWLFYCHPHAYGEFLAHEGRLLASEDREPVARAEGRAHAGVSLAL